MSKKKFTTLIIVMVLLLPFFIVGLTSVAFDVVFPVVYGNGAAGGGAFAGGGGAINVLGGTIEGIIQCNCSVGHVAKISPPRGGSLHYVPATDVRPYNQTKTVGAWQLGINKSPTPCLVHCAPFICCAVPHRGDVILVGTSKGPGGTADGQICDGFGSCSTFTGDTIPIDDPSVPVSTCGGFASCAGGSDGGSDGGN